MQSEMIETGGWLRLNVVTQVVMKRKTKSSQTLFDHMRTMSMLERGEAHQVQTIEPGHQEKNKKN